MIHKRQNKHSMEKTKVLFIDDDTMLGNIVVAALTEMGYETHYQTSLAAIRSILRELCPDIVVLDVEIGTGDGIQAIAEVKSVLPDVPVLFVSSHTDSSYIKRALEAGGIAYLKKPFEIEELLAYIQRHVSSRSSLPTLVPIGSLTLDTEGYLLREEERIVKKLTPLECKLLTLLARNLDQVVSRETIERGLWPDGNANGYSLNNFVLKLRKDLSEGTSLEIVTIPKKGYRLVAKH